MAKTKKALSLVLAIVMVLSIFAINAFAADEAATLTVTTNASGDLALGNTVVVTVSATSDYYVGPTSVPVTYDPAVFSLVENSVTTAAIFGATATESVVNTDTAGKVVVALTPNAAQSPTAQIMTNTTLFSFTLTVIGGSGSTSIAIQNDQKTETYAGRLYVGSSSGADINSSTISSIGQVLTPVPATVNIASAVQQADLELTSAGTTAGVLIDTHKTFGGTYAGIVYGFTQTLATTFRSTTFITSNVQATNGGSLVFGRTIGTAGYGTGTTITVKNSDGSDSGRVYVVVIFGDVNGDGLINGNDTSAVKLAVSSATNAPANSVKRMAANCQPVANGTMMHTLNGNDTTYVKNYVNGVKFSATDLATKQYTYNTFYQ